MAGVTPKVSVIIPTYNRAHLIKRSIKSVLAQTYQDFEIIVVDDASTDTTREVVASMEDPRITYIRHDHNKGAGAARNTGIRAARGDYLAFLDSDDEWLPKKLERQTQEFEELPDDIGVIYTDMWRVDGAGRHYFPAPRIAMEHGREALRYRAFGIGTVSMMIRRSCFDQVGLFDESLPALEDSELLMRMLPEFGVKHLREALVNYYASNDGVTANLRAVADAWEQILAKHYEGIARDGRTMAFYRVGMWRWNRQCGRYGRAAHSLWVAMKADPAGTLRELAVIAYFSRSLRPVRVLITRLLALWERRAPKGGCRSAHNGEDAFSD